MELSVVAGHQTADLSISVQLGDINTIQPSVVDNMRWKELTVSGWMKTITSPWGWSFTNFWKLFSRYITRITWPSGPEITSKFSLAIPTQYRSVPDRRTKLL